MTDTGGFDREAARAIIQRYKSDGNRTIRTFSGHLCAALDALDAAGRDNDVLTGLTVELAEQANRLQAALDSADLGPWG